MNLTPFTLEEAEEICEDFEDLVDTEFKIGASPVMLVENVVAAPFASADKDSFAERYFASRDRHDALSFYAGADYDVLVITYEADDDTNFSHIGIRDFAELRGIKYEFPVKD